MLRHAGSLCIDGGRPLPGLVEQTVRNLSEISPTVYFNVPAGYAAILPFLERDETLARAFFAKLRLIFYAGAALPQDIWHRLEKLSEQTIGERVPMTSSWGTTETSPWPAAHFILKRAGSINPGAGVEPSRAGGQQARSARSRPQCLPAIGNARILRLPLSMNGFYCRRRGRFADGRTGKGSSSTAGQRNFKLDRDIGLGRRASHWSARRPASPARPHCCGGKRIHRRPGMAQRRRLSEDRRAKTPLGELAAHQAA